MCHVLLLLPVLALPVFWLWPPGIAWPVYGVAVAASLGIYAMVYWSWRAPLAHGPQVLLGASGTVVSIGERQITLRIGGELWLADVKGAPLALGENAEVVAVDGLRLTARKRREAEQAWPGA